MLIPWMVLALLSVVQAEAFETDQFTPPPTPLFDMGPELNELVLGYIKKAIEETNTKLKSADAKQKKKLLSEAYIAGRVNRAACPVLKMLCEPETWALESSNKDQLRHFRPSIEDSIYWLAYSPVPFSFVFDSPTVNFLGTYLGTDKIGHMFGQGYGYYKIYMKNVDRGATDKEARKKAVAHGVMQENTYFGTMIDGVYSNGDLSADYAGLTFYLNLTREVRIGDQTLSPILKAQDDQWQITERASVDRLYNPFISVDAGVQRIAFARNEISRNKRDLGMKVVHHGHSPRDFSRGHVVANMNVAELPNTQAV